MHDIVLVVCMQQEKVIAELTTHIQMVQQSATCKYDSATPEYLKAIRKIFECGLMTRSLMEMPHHYQVSPKDYSTLRNGVMKQKNMVSGS